MFRLVASRTLQRSIISQIRLQSTAPTTAYDEIIQSIRQDLKLNIRKRADPLEKNVIRSILTEVKNMEIESQNKPKDEFALYDLVSKMIKQRKATAEEYFKEGSPDKFHQIGLNELREVEFLEKYLTKMPVASQEEVEAKVLGIAEALQKDGLLNTEADLFKRIPWGAIKVEWKASRASTSAAVKSVFKKLSEEA
ncbi:unnamed protein product [Ambrosiozyma monospora]|uniref:Unnamed protein product n=1 Tax=Ambrosiozyma monospora TaxID=43982 RepID=A0ACB5TWF8_AMBMO|nr:unnamed protein product [Ambrosiozyma monospora]